jgi:hypothetical protein
MKSQIIYRISDRGGMEPTESLSLLTTCQVSNQVDQEQYRILCNNQGSILFLYESPGNCEVLDTHGDSNDADAGRHQTAPRILSR